MKKLFAIIAAVALIVSGCTTTPEINPRKRKPFTKCRKHRIEQTVLENARYKAKHLK